MRPLRLQISCRLNLSVLSAARQLRLQAAWNERLAEARGFFSGAPQIALSFCAQLRFNLRRGGESEKQLRQRSGHTQTSEHGQDGKNGGEDGLAIPGSEDTVINRIKGGSFRRIAALRENRSF
jgi:hypothetical protein